MEFQQLEMFAAAVEEGNITRAAVRVYRTAPAVSIALRKLEDEMGSPLFDRSERHDHKLTASGKLLYSYATRILEMRREAAAAVRDLTRGNRGSLRIGTHESTSLYLLPSLIYAFNEAHPGVKIEVVCGNSEHMLTALDNRLVEFALIAEAPDQPKLERHLIVRDELVMITSPQHRLAGLKQVHVHDLAGELLIVQGTKSMLRERIVRAFQESETPFNVSVENIAIEAIKRMVAEDIGIGFVPLMCVREESARRNLIVIRVDGINREWDLWLVRRRDQSISPVARSFLSASLALAQSHETRQVPALEQNEKNASGRTGKRQSFPAQPRRTIHC
jgi:DNA-binding transcriptional LysR family regulator